LNVGLGISTAANNFIQGSVSGNFCIFNSSTTASPILFGIYDSGAGNTVEAARISAARNFIIGQNTDPGYKLFVNGNAYFSTGTSSKFFYTIGAYNPSSTNCVGIFQNTEYTGIGYTKGAFIAGNGATGVMIGGDGTYTYAWIQAYQSDSSGSLKNLSLQGAGGSVIISGTSNHLGENLQVIGTAYISGAISIGNSVAAGVAVASTHKVSIIIGGVQYYLLASNV
jgi:hypothetical protein